MDWVDALFIEKLRPKGFLSREVHIDLNGTVAQNVVQWDIPLCTSKLKKEKSIYDTNNICAESGITIYSQEILDFLPPFEKEISQDICLSQEFFGEGLEAFHKIIVIKRMRDFFIQNGILNLNQFQPIKQI